LEAPPTVLLMGLDDNSSDLQKIYMTVLFFSFIQII
jgi:hypothetical protein